MEPGESKDDVESGKTIAAVLILCKKCNKSFSGLRLYNRHTCTKGQDKGPFLCQICSMTFTRKDSLQTHVIVHHEEKPATKRSIPSKERKHVCEVCGTAFLKISHLDEHVKMKHMKGVALAHQCDRCHMSFLRAYQLTYHVNKDHLNSKPFACSSCEKKFYGERACKEHIRSKICCGMDTADYLCTLCEKRFSRKSQLQNHLAAVHYGGAYTCVCGTKVRWATSVPKHKRRCKAFQKYLSEHGEQIPVDNVNVIAVQYSESSKRDPVSVGTSLPSDKAEQGKDKNYVGATIIEHESVAEDIDEPSDDTALPIVSSDTALPLHNIVDLDVLEQAKQTDNV